MADHEEALRHWQSKLEEELFRLAVACLPSDHVREVGQALVERCQSSRITDNDLDWWRSKLVSQILNTALACLPSSRHSAFGNMLVTYAVTDEELKKRVAEQAELFSQVTSK